MVFAIQQSLVLSTVSGKQIRTQDKEGAKQPPKNIVFCYSVLYVRDLLPQEVYKSSLQPHIKRLAANDLHPRIPATGPVLTAEHRRIRLQFARDHINWTNPEWACVLFTGESRFCLFNNDRRVRVYMPNVT